MDKFYTVKNIALTKEIINELVKIIDDYNSQIVESKQKIGYDKNILALLVNRMKLNLRGIEANLDNFKNSNQNFLPIAHLSRALTTDYLNFYYLQLFYNEDEANHDFKNEIKLFDRDLYNTMKDLNKIQSEYFGVIDDETINSKQKKLEEKFLDLVENEKVKCTSNLRKTTKFKFPEKFRTDEPEKHFTESYKFRLLKEMGGTKEKQIFIFNKYFSQQYHFSTLSDNLLHNSEENFYYLIKIVGHAILILRDYMDIMAVKIDYLIQRLEFIERKYIILSQNG